MNLALGVLVQFLDVRGAPGNERFRLFHQSLRDYLGDIGRSGRFACPSADTHGAIADTYWHTFDQTAARRAWNNCDTYGLAHLPAHLDAAGAGERLRKLRFDYDWLQTKLDRLGANALLADFNLSRESADDATMRLVRALEQGAHVLAQDPMQLAAQLSGRLMDDEDSNIRALLAQARWLCRRPCLLPVTASLRESGALLRTLTGHTAGVNSVAVTPDGRSVVSASWDHTLKVWDLAHGGYLATFHAGGAPYTCAITPDGRTIVAAGESGRLHFLRLEE